MSSERSALFPALLKHWRRARGLSQLDLALAAGVSARHVSFLETGRSQPSRGMILRLAGALDVPLRDQNDMLRAAGLEPAFEEPSLPEALSGALDEGLTRMMAHHEPFPMVVLDRRYDVIRANRGAEWLMARFVADPSALTPPINAMHLLFDPRLARPFVVGWERLGRQLLSRLHRESLGRPRDEALVRLRDELLQHEGVPADLAEPDLGAGSSDPTFTLRVAREDLELAFFGTVTLFSAPQNVTLEELRIESYFPLDERTRRTCEEIG